MGGADNQRKAAAFARWHEPDESRGSCERLGVKLPGAITVGHRVEPTRGET
jgi:hypothetical protein